MSNVPLAPQPHLPLQGYSILETRSEMIARYPNGMFARTTSFDATKDAFRLAINMVSFDAFKLCAVGTSGHRIRLLDEENVAVLIPLQESIEIDDGRTVAKAHPGDCIVTSPPRRLSTVSPNYIGLVLLTSRGRLATHQQMTGARTGSRAKDFTALYSAGNAAAGMLSRYVRFLTSEFDRSETLVQSRPIQAINALLMELVSQAFDAPADAGSDQRQIAAPWQVARAEALMRRDAGHPLTMAAIAAETGTSLRALQLAFQRHHGVSPRAYLESCRLDMVRERLARAAPGTSVTDVAYDCGVAHLSRFSARYRERFGELPSETLRQAWRKA